MLTIGYYTTIPAAAHVLKQDNGISGVLHIPPEDDPSAAQPTELNLSFGDARDAFSLADCNCTVVVKTSTGAGSIARVVETAPLHPYYSDSTLDSKTSVTFPTIGVYNVIVKGSARDSKFPAFQLDYLVRVATSADGSTAPANNNGTAVVFISVSSLIILGMIAYTNMRVGGRYVTPSKETRKKTSLKKVNKKKTTTVKRSKKS
jgi:hypothetical protein